MRIVRALAAALAASIVVAGSLAVAGAGAASAQGNITVSPNINLIGNKVVSVKGGGFTPSETVNVYECGPSSSVPSTCDTANTQATTAGATGKIPTVHFTLNVGVIDGVGDQCGTVLSGPTGCYIVAIGSSSGQTNQVGLTFKLPSISVAGLTMPDPTNTVPFQIPKVNAANVTLTAVGNRVVKLIGKNFPIGDSVGLAECNQGVLVSQSESDCDLSTAVVATANSGGVLKASGLTPTMTLLEGTAYSDSNGGGCGPSGSDFPPNYTGDCVIGAADVSNQAVANAAEFQWATPTLSVNTTTFPDVNGTHGPATASFKAEGFPIGDPIVGLECETALLSNLGSPSAEENYCDISNLIEGTASGNKGIVAGPFNALTGKGWSPSNKLPVLTDNTSPAYSDTNGGQVNVANGGVLATGDANNETLGAFVSISIS